MTADGIRKVMHMKTKDKIAAIRKHYSLSQDEFAEPLFVSRQAVSQWETGETIPSTDTLVLISQKYEIPLNALIGSEPLYWIAFEIKFKQARDRINFLSNPDYKLLMDNDNPTRPIVQMGRDSKEYEELQKAASSNPEIKGVRKNPFNYHTANRFLNLFPVNIGATTETVKQN
jgi:transcriptional regulator with XRE-family HTH domain